MVCWFSDQPLRAGGTYPVKHTTRTAKARVQALHYRLDVNTLHRDEAHGALALNDIGRVTLRTAVPLFVDEYRRNRDHRQLHPHRRGHLRDRRRRDDPRPAGALTPRDRARPARTSSGTRARCRAPSGGRAAGVRGATVWFTGLSGSGKSTVAAALDRAAHRARRAHLHARRRQPAPRPQRRPRLLRRRPRPRTCAASARWRGCSPTPASSRSSRSSARTAPGATTPARCTRPPGSPFVEVFVDTPHRGVRAARPEGPLRQGARRRDHRVHRHRRPVRAARSHPSWCCPASKIGARRGGRDPACGWRSRRGLRRLRCDRMTAPMIRTRPALDGDAASTSPGARPSRWRRSTPSATSSSSRRTRRRSGRCRRRSPPSPTPPRGVNRYPDDAATALREALAAHYGVAPEQVLLGERVGRAVPHGARRHVRPRRRGGVRVAVVRGLPDPRPAGRRHDGAGAAASTTATTSTPWPTRSPTAPASCSCATPTTRPAPRSTATPSTRFLDRVPSDLLVVFDEAYREFVTAPDFPDGLDCLARPRERRACCAPSRRRTGSPRCASATRSRTPSVIGALRKVRVPFDGERARAGGRVGVARRARRDARARRRGDRRTRARLRRHRRARPRRSCESEANFLWLAAPRARGGARRVQRTRRRGAATVPRRRRAHHHRHGRRERPALEGAARRRRTTARPAERRLKGTGSGGRSAGSDRVRASLTDARGDRRRSRRCRAPSPARARGRRGVRWNARCAFSCCRSCSSRSMRRRTSSPEPGGDQPGAARRACRPSRCARSRHDCSIRSRVA